MELLVCTAIPMLRDFLLFGGAVVCAASMLGCASSEDGTGQTQDAAFVCAGELDTVSTGWGVRCPATFAAAMADAQQCTRADFAAVQSGSCGTLSAYGYAWSDHSLKCFYDQDVLVGAAAHDGRLPSYCSQSAYGIQAGRADPQCSLAPIEPPAGCVRDAGADVQAEGSAPDAQPEEDGFAPVEPSPDAPDETDGPGEADAVAPPDAPSDASGGG
jgi:hypothetical protein